jgi:hypothetical protein
MEVEKGNFSYYDEKRADWVRRLVGDQHSIQSQVRDLLWDDAIYRTFGQIFELYQENDPNVGFNSSLMGLLIRNFFANQSSRIRKLIDNRKDVISLFSLIRDLSRYSHLITRENYVCFDGIPYDTAQIEKDYIKQRLKQKKPSGVPEEMMKSKIRHKEFDHLCGTNETNRSRMDGVNKKEITGLNSYPKCKEVEDFVNKYIAHASDWRSREHINRESFEVSLDKFDECYRELARAAKSVGGFIGETVAWQVPVPQFDLFKNIEKPMIKKKDTRKLREYWHSRMLWIRDLSKEV